MSHLSFEQVNDLISYDPVTGLFVWKRSRGRCKAGSNAGTITSKGAISIFINGKRYFGHRVAWLLMTGAWPSVLIDHKDMVPSNNEWTNLREATHSENHANALAHRDHDLPRGVSFDKRRMRNPYSARICVNYQTICLGTFPTAGDASVAYQAAATMYFGEFARAA